MTAVRSALIGRLLFMVKRTVDKNLMAVNFKLEHPYILQLDTVVNFAVCGSANVDFWK